MPLLKIVTFFVCSGLALPLSHRHTPAPWGWGWELPSQQQWLVERAHRSHRIYRLTQLWGWILPPAQYGYIRLDPAKEPKPSGRALTHPLVCFPDQRSCKQRPRSQDSLGATSGTQGWNALRARGGSKKKENLPSRIKSMSSRHPLP